MGGLGTQELLLLMLLALIFFGSKKLPEISRGLGKGMAEFKKAARDVQLEITKELDQATDLNSKKVIPPPESQELTDQGAEQNDTNDDVGDAPGEAS